MKNNKYKRDSKMVCHTPERSLTEKSDSSKNTLGN